MKSIHVAVTVVDDVVVVVVTLLGANSLRRKPTDESQNVSSVRDIGCERSGADSTKLSALLNSKFRNPVSSHAFKIQATQDQPQLEKKET